jgi:hypothetical protein
MNKLILDFVGRYVTKSDLWDGASEISKGPEYFYIYSDLHKFKFLVDGLDYFYMAENEEEKFPFELWKVVESPEPITNKYEIAGSKLNKEEISELTFWLQENLKDKYNGTFEQLKHRARLEIHEAIDKYNGEDSTMDIELRAYETFDGSPKLYSIRIY